MCLSIYNYYITYDITIITIENDKNIKIETDEDVGLDDKLKAWARALGKKWKTLIEIGVKNMKQKKAKKEYLIENDVQ
jgi:hypothetical protein